MKLTTTYNELKEVMTKVVPACATDISRPVLTGIYIEQYKDHNSFVSADGYRLAILNPELVEQPVTTSLVTVKSIREAIKTIETSSKAFYGSRNKWKWENSRIEVELETMVGSFPNYKQLIPKKDSAVHILELKIVDLLADAIDILKVAANKGSGIIRLQSTNLEDKKTVRLLLSANYFELETTLEVYVPLNKFTGETVMKIATNVNHLQDLCKSLKDTRDITIEISSPSSPIKVTTPNYIHVVMPMFVQW